MALTITRDSAYFNPVGGGVIRVQEANSNQTVTPGTPVVDLGYLKETNMTDKPTMFKAKDETGRTIKPLIKEREVMVTGTFMQNNKAVLDIAEECRNKYYRLYKLNTIPGSATAQEVFYGFGTITPQFDLKFEGGEIPFEFEALPVTSAISISGATLTASPSSGFGAVTTSPVTIAANKYYTIVES